MWWNIGCGYWWCESTFQYYFIAGNSQSVWRSGAGISFASSHSYNCAYCRESSGKGLRLADILEIQRFFRNFKCIDYQGPAMIAYRIIYIADNRAASARERYWLDRISECRWNTLDSIAIEIKKMLPKRHHMIALSSLPREHSQP